MSGIGPRDLLSLLREQADAGPQAVAILTEDGRSLSRAMVFEQSSALAGALLPALEGKAGRGRIGIVLPNGSDLALTLLGAMLAGVAVPFNPALGPDDAMAALRRTRLDVLVVDADTADGPVASAARHMGLRVLSRSDLVGVDAAPARLERPDPDDIAVVLQTSGSTGAGKLVPLSHRNICASAGDVARSMGLGSDDRCLCMWEQHHIGGVVDLLLAPLISGGSVVMAGGFHAGRFFELLPRVRPTWFQGVPATLAELVLLARRNGHDGGDGLRLIRSVAAALSPSGHADLESVFKVPVIQTFGMTEAGPLITSTALPPAPRKPGSVGRPFGPTIRILAADGTDVPEGAQGEVAIRGENVFSGYEDDPEANARAFRDGWFLTGDLGRLDADGDLFLTGRIKQQINRGGEKFTPDEIDVVLADHPAVAEAAAFGVPHKTLGEDVAAAVVLAPGKAVSALELRGWVTERLAPFKVPGRVIFLDALPRTPVGKVDRPALSALAAQRREAAPSDAPSAAPVDSSDRRLQELVSAIWAKELELPSVGPDEDFAELGGDSLSALRVHLALEQLFAIRISEGEARKLRSVRITAAFLRKRGATPQGDRSAGGADRIEPGDAGPGTDIADLYASLGRCGRGTELRALIDAVTVKAAPSELAALVSNAPPTDPDASRPLTVRAKLWLWRTGMRSRLARFPEASAWNRRSVSPYLDVYDGGHAPRKDKTLIVGFSGNMMRLMLPAWNILTHLDPKAYDLLVICDPERGHYVDGVPGLGGDMQALARSLAPEAEGYGRTLAFGTSAGGLAALAAARLNGWQGAVAVGPDKPSAHPRMKSLLQELSPRPGHALICYGADRGRDAGAADEIASILGSATLAPYPGVRQHNLLLHLLRRRRLASAFDAWFTAAPFGASGAGPVGSTASVKR